MDKLVRNGLRINTQRTYSSSQRNYLYFCLGHGLLLYPVNEETLLMCVASLNNKQLKPSTIQVYLSAVQSLHIEMGYGNPLEGSLRLKLALKGIQFASDPPAQKLPITSDILLKMIELSYEDRLLRAAMILAYFGLFRAAEICTVNLKLKMLS